MKYLSRIADLELQNKLRYMGAVLIEGPKWCGKTTTGAQYANSILRLQDPDLRAAYFATADTKPSNLLQGATPRLIDEWQDIPVIWDAVRTMVDNRGEPGQFILTGSNSVDESKILHSGIGRISRMKMYPMSLYESGESNGKISIKEIFDNPGMEIDGISSEMSVNDLIYAACRGGWPAALRIRNKRDRLQVAKEYFNGVVATDIIRVDGVRRSPLLAKAILRSYSRNIGTLAKNSVLMQDVRAMDENCSDKTFSDYVGALTKLFVVQDISAWSPAVRSATVIRRGTKRNLIDPSIAVAALELSPEILEKDMRTFGFLFECMAIRDLQCYTQHSRGHISYYHDRYGLEADAVLHLDDGRYALIEFKLGTMEIEKGAQHLLEIKHLVEQYNEREKQIKMRKPDLLIIITGGSIAYTRADGVKVIPLACLRD